jgi:hypothetical protein
MGVQESWFGLLLFNSPPTSGVWSLCSVWKQSIHNICRGPHEYLMKLIRSLHLYANMVYTGVLNQDYKGIAGLYVDHSISENSCGCDLKFDRWFWLCEGVFCKAMKLMRSMLEESDQTRSIINECMVRDELLIDIEIEVQIGWEAGYAHHHSAACGTFRYPA